MVHTIKHLHAPVFVKVNAFLKIIILSPNFDEEALIDYTPIVNEATERKVQV